MLSLLDPVLTLALLATVGVTAFLAARRHPFLGFVTWIAVVCLVPYWFNLTLGFDWSISALLAVLLVAALLPVRQARLGLADAVMAVIIACYLTASLLGDASLGSGVVLLGHWGLGYLLGRILPERVDMDRVTLVIAFAFSGVAALGIIEFLTGVNPFVGLAAPGALYETWGPLQERGGVTRVEGAFGHSIAFGCSLALAVPFVLAARLRSWLRTLMLVLILTATVLTLSRTAMVCVALALVLTLAFSRGIVSGRFAALFAALGALVAAVLFPFLVSVFESAAEEAEGSAGYRGDLLGLVDELELLGQSSAFQRAPDGTTRFGEFDSIDSALILLGLNHGLLPLALVCALLVAATVLVAIRRATPATIALVAQIPAFATVALITQYAILVWFIAGLAVASQLATRPKGRDPALLPGQAHVGAAPPTVPPVSVPREPVPPRSHRLPAGISQKGTSR
ncbi:hypothetical protein OH146_06640 [Salinibacterium sp. SYSU T00001]|uniref:hypothetical protein n=1 Tax=Homoserinimonas sedimenticola TaxID=2986805 RepID=UPI0022366FB1|nr:hypothetical protein [Salinibacterium sedimenticola]MCW4385446.1 hypothetical protein [Salinibacterium sedimenticola]